MLSLLPVALLILSAVVIQVIGRVTPRAGSTWFLAAIFGFVAWLSMILVGFLLPPAVVISNWLPQPYIFASLTFQLTQETWIFGFLLVSLLQAVIFFNSRYLDTPNYLNKITGAMILTAFGLLAVLSRSPLAFVLTWSLMDLAEFGVLAATLGNALVNRSTLTAVLFRELGIILLVLVMSVLPEQNLASVNLNSLTSWLLLLIVLFRLGILPLIKDQIDDSRLQRGFLTLLRALPLITAFSFITLLPGLAFNERAFQLILVVFTIAALYGSLQWFFSKEELAARPYWFFTIGILGIMALLTNTSGALTSLAVVVISAGTGIFLYSPRLLNKYAYVPFLLVGMLALPFTPTAALTYLFDSETYRFYQVLLVPAYALLLAGIIKHGLRKDEVRSLEEPWTRLFHNISLYYIALTPWIIVGTLFKMFKFQVNWLLSISVFLFTALFTTLFVILKSRSLFLRKPFKNILTVVIRTSGIIDQVFRLTWLTKLFSSISFVINKAVIILMRVQEGDGGVLWSFLFLVLLISLLITRQAP